MSADYLLAAPALKEAGIDITADFSTLPSSAVSVLVEMARKQGYRKPRNANGSRGRYYFAAIQRQYRKQS